MIDTQFASLAPARAGVPGRVMHSSVKIWSDDEWLERFRSRARLSPIGLRCSRYCRSDSSDRCHCAVSADIVLVQPGSAVAGEQGLEGLQVHWLDQMMIEAGLA